MDTFKSFKDALYSVNDSNFEDIALRLFRFQASNNPVYQQYLKHLNTRIDSIQAVSQIPFLPINFFKSQAVKTGDWEPQAEFTSSGTTGSTTSRHLVYDLEFYQALSTRIFEHTYGPLTNYHIVALLPSYLERSGSSLVAMVDHFIKQSESEYSGYYLYNHQELIENLGTIKQGKRQVILWGVTFALLDLAEAHPVDLGNAIIMETGGMKGRRRELIREEVHGYLMDRFRVPAVHSEYGMTELMSQAYSQGGGYYTCPPWMKVFTRDLNDPFQWVSGRAGIINVIDLANFHSCAFIETQDLGRLSQPGYFEVLGRMDNSDVRGCNLLVG